MDKEKARKVLRTNVLNYIPATTLFFKVTLVIVLAIPLVWLRWDWIYGNHELIRNIGFALAGLIGFPMLVWRTRIADRQAATGEASHVAETYTKAIEQLGSTSDDGRPRLELRLGGLYALEKISRNSSDYHHQIMEVLCAYIRMHAPLEGEKPTVAKSRNEKKCSLRVDIKTALSILNRRKISQDKGQFSFDLAHTFLGYSVLSSFDFSGADLKGTEFCVTDLANSNFTGAQLMSSNFAEADLTGSSFQEAFLTDANFEDARMFRVNLNDAVLFRAKLQRAGLMNANFNGANLTSANLEEATLTDATLVGATLVKANLEESDLIEANLQNAKLVRTNLKGAILVRANLSGSNLTKADLSGSDLEGANLAGADLSRANLCGATLTNANLAGAKLDYVKLKAADLTKMNLTGATYEKLVIVDEEEIMEEG
ncbi:pentapeptide repeat-containing protein [Marinobacterium rhizophilum]|uniref:Pentapeptide repeat-containing protein n=1 Tax=Marinobacterium rhizophilum TaxID=420402 RepID=A0ABY5HM86_9GAMM|nr:pentapeptide repeat-containing protein [Marinobacterium rhizophilum]UTW12922.1 pentapeptide repeat-containing protein [Marinobacterium rhizophilum]